MDSIRTVQRAIDILNCFSIHESELTLTEIASKIGLAKSTTTRLLGTLELNNCVAKNPDTMKYRLGHKLHYLGFVAGKSLKLTEVARPIMDELRDEVSETVNLYMLEDVWRVCIMQSESVHELRHLVRLGEKMPLWLGASGKVMLSNRMDVWEKLLKTRASEVEPFKGVQEQFARIQDQGFATSIGEREAGLSAVAAPIYNGNGQVFASLSISGPSPRFTKEQLERSKTPLIAAAAKISQFNGFLQKRNE
ncbi:IclR family transcriptional regulator [Shouchella shacheensis]|uniref:IclR family transcriptional regulator n=1 Tax=Shouchella shacheensis TaxID=1649580 RepID=UPI00074037EF|nr:IclR family transcriptional regulator [Shouchella shacheensis]